jgi:hypothetical protein
VELPPDLIDLLREFAAADVQYLLVGGYAVAVHAEPRFTKDIDLWLNPEAGNLRQAEAALARFGAPERTLEALRSLSGLDVAWMGNPPLRFDFMVGVPGGRFEAAWPRRLELRWQGVPVSVVGARDLVELKRASGRAQDLVDAEAVEARLHR